MRQPPGGDTGPGAEGTDGAAEGSGSESTGGAGRGGGLLFVAVLVFLAYLALEALAGVLRLAVAGILVVLAVVLLGRVLKRR